MTKKTIAVPSLRAHQTSWAIDDDGNILLVLEDEEETPFAVAAYTLEQWAGVFENLREVSKDPKVAKPLATTVN